MRIPELLMNIILCNRFVNNTKSDFILLFHRKLVSYYLSKGLVLHVKNPTALRNVHKHVKKIINAEHIYKNDFIMICHIEILFASNTLKSITIFMVCTHTLHQRTKMIKKVFLYSFL